MPDGAVALRRDDRFGNRSGVFPRDTMAEENLNHEVGQFTDADGLWHRTILRRKEYHHGRTKWLGLLLAGTTRGNTRPGRKMPNIVIIGGGVIGSAMAYYLAVAGHAADVAVIEPDPTYEFAATPRATGGIRQLFTVPENIRIAQYGHEIYGQFETLMAVNGDPAPIDFHRMGYLWLGSGEADVHALMANWRVQTAHDARIELLDRKGVKHRFPSMRVDDIDIAAFSPDDGYMDPHSVLMGFRRKAISLGIRYLKDRVVDFDVAGKRVAAVRLDSGARLATDSVVNAANCWGPSLCEKLGMK